MQSPQVGPEVAQIYEDDRNGKLLQLLYVDEQVVLFRSEEQKRRSEDHAHRLMPRPGFDRQVEADRLKHRPDSDLDVLELAESKWEEVDHIGQKTADNLREAGFNTVIDVRQADEAKLLTIDGLGVAGLDNLQQFCQ